MDLSLVMFTAEGDRRDFRIYKPRTIVGRQNNCDLRIPLPSVSRQHCEIRREEGSAVLRDLGSSNGTYHNNKRVQSTRLSAGDQLVIGPVLFTVVLDGYPQEVRPVRSLITRPQESESSALPPEASVVSEQARSAETSDASPAQGAWAEPATPNPDDTDEAFDAGMDSFIAHLEEEDQRELPTVEEEDGGADESGDAQDQTNSQQSPRS
jgi:pSer/pThr/pTyr-binding forkhead associated (FHA) protein